MTEALEKTLVKTDQKINLVDGKFTAQQATHVVDALIDEIINFHKLQRLIICEGNHDSETPYEIDRIKELQSEKVITKNHINIARLKGYDVVINGTLEISFVEK